MVMQLSNVFTVMVTGSRHYRDADTMLQVLTNVQQEHTYTSICLLHGDAPGADSLAQNIAAHLGWEVQAFPAEWKQYGKKAGPLRNQQMVDAAPDVLLAFPSKGSIGTWDAVRRAKKAAIEVKIFD